MARSLPRWLESRRIELEAGDLSPGYFRELERWCKAGGHFSYWEGKSVHEIDEVTVDDFALWLAKKGLSAKTRKSILAGFHKFINWLFVRREINERPRSYPWPVPQEHVPTILSLTTQRQILDAIPKDRRGPFLAMALLGMRPSEVCHLKVTDYSDGWISIRKSKNRKGRRLPVPLEVEDWISKFVPGERRLRGGFLFEIPYRGSGVVPEGPWSWNTLDKAWRKACREVGVTCPMYSGTKHTFATHLEAEERVVQHILGHEDVRSTRRYRQLKDSAVLSALRPSDRRS